MYLAKPDRNYVVNLLFPFFIDFIFYHSRWFDQHLKSKASLLPVLPATQLWTCIFDESRGLLNGNSIALLKLCEKDWALVRYLMMLLVNPGLGMQADFVSIYGSAFEKSYFQNIERLNKKKISAIKFLDSKQKQRLEHCVDRLRWNVLHSEIKKLLELYLEEARNELVIAEPENKMMI